MQEKLSPWKKNFSSRLKTALKGHKQQDIACAVGVRQSALSGYSNAKILPSLDVFRSLCESLEVNPSWLLGLSDSRDGDGTATATNGSAAATGNASATVSTGGAGRDAEVARLLALVESQQRVIETLSKQH